MIQIGRSRRSLGHIEQCMEWHNHWEPDNLPSRMAPGAANQVKSGDIAYHGCEDNGHDLRRNTRHIGIFENTQEALKRLERVIPIRPANLLKVNLGRYSRDTTSEKTRMPTDLNRSDELRYEDAVAMFDRS